MFRTPTLFGSSLFDDFRRLEQEMDALFGRWPGTTPGIRSMGRSAFPPVNVGSTPDQVGVYLFAPGIDPNSLDISIQRNLLSVAGERAPSAAEGADFYRRERFSGQFRRVISLPEDVDPDKVEAGYRDGILQITVQRREAAKPRQIEVK